MTHPIDAAKAYVRAFLASSKSDLFINRTGLALLSQPDPRVTALVDAVKDYLAGTVNDNFDLRNDLWAALAPFMENQDAN